MVKEKWIAFVTFVISINSFFSRLSRRLSISTVFFLDIFLEVLADYLCGRGIAFGELVSRTKVFWEIPEFPF